MRYTAKQIIERSMNLADISNTDFLTHTELTQYLNDAWATVYQWLINKGDSQFVRQVSLTSTGSGSSIYTLPSDLYQIKSLRNPYTGKLLQRRSESESDYSGTYEVVNDTLRLYGVGYQGIVLTYWMTPTYISFPDKDIDVDLGGYGIIDSCKDTVLLDNGTIYNVLTQTTLGSIDVSDYTHKYVLGNGHVMEIVDGATIYYRSFGDNIIYSDTNNRYPIKYFKDKDGNVLYQFFNSGYSDAYFMGRQVIDTDVRLLADDAYYDESTNRLYVSNAYIELDYIPSEFVNAPDWDNKRSFYILDSNQDLHRYVVMADGIEELELDIPVGLYKSTLSYGPVISNGTYDTLYSGIPDTALNFPNELYFSLLSCDLALRFAMKMNANTDGLNNLYQNMQTTYMNTLSQDGAYTRMTNVY